MNTENQAYAKIDEVAAQFAIEGKLKEKSPYGNGHINDTFLLIFELSDCSQKRYILQRMNHSIFKNPQQLMENVVNVTEYLRKIISSQGGDPERETLNVVKTRKGDNYYVDDTQNYWRVFLFIENTICMEQVESSKDFYDSAVAFGHFQKMLAEYPAEKLYETIPNFHNTPIRVRNFLEALSKDVVSRAKECEKEIQFVLERKDTLNLVVEGLQDGSIPLRVTHNDTKLNNILMDADTLKARAVIDLDTIMPGSMLYDFGDSIRFGASTAAEDEKNLELVHFDRSLFEAYTRGYYTAVADSITPKEVELLPYSAYLLTMECGIRFLTDYLMGDVYFATKYKEHNLIRCRTQFKLALEIYEVLDELKCLVKRIQEETK